MTGPAGKKYYTFYMPGEERIFFRYLHWIALSSLLLISLLGFISRNMAAGDAVLSALLFVAPVYSVCLMFRKRFAAEVALDFDLQKVRFVFQDERGMIQRDFQEIRKIRFGFYLTFVMDDASIMVKRPDNKKEIFLLLNPLFKVDMGVLGMR